MTAFWDGLAGRRTYILAGLVMAAVLALVFSGQLTPEMAYTVALFALAGFAVTFRSAIEEHHAQVLSVLMDVGQLGVAVRKGDKAGELAAVQDLGKQAVAASAAQNKPNLGADL